MCPVTNEQQHLIEAFLSAQNRIEKYLQQELRMGLEASFSQLITFYERRHRAWPDGWQLRRYAELRNVLVHDRIEPYKYLSVPLPEVVEDIESIEARLIQPERVIPRFQRPVTTIEVEDSLAKVLMLVNTLSYSQFPVYQGREFKTLLTENGITRWLARYVTAKMALVDLSEIPISRVLEEEEPRKNCIFVGRETPVTDVLGLFMETELLEAVLITHSGSSGQQLIGIITRWDIAELQ